MRDGVQQRGAATHATRPWTARAMREVCGLGAWLTRAVDCRVLNNNALSGPIPELSALTSLAQL